MDRDLRGTPLYQAVEEYFQRALGPAFGMVSGAADVHPSPDGTRIAFTGSVLDGLEGVPHTRICEADMATGTFREVTGGPNDDKLPQWSPDGGGLAFLSDRTAKDAFQLWRLDAARMGEAIPTPPVEGSVEYFRWSPDGSSILLGVAGVGADAAGVQGSGTVGKDAGDLPAWTPSVRGSEETGWRRVFVHEVDAEQTRPLSREGLNVWEAVWCGPEAVAAIVSDAPAEWAWYAAPLALIDRDTGKERVVYRSQRQLGVPAASESGRRLAVVEAVCSDRMVVAGDLVVVDPEDGSALRVDTGGVDVTHLAWRDEDHLFFVGLRGMDTVAGEFDAATGRTTELWSSAESCGFIYPQAEPIGPSAFALVLQSYRRPPTVAVVDGGEVRPVVALEHPGTDHVRAVAGRVEAVSWTAPDGMEIQGLLARPEGKGPFPLLLNVHGGPVAAVQDRWPSRSLLPLLVGRGFAVLHPNPRGSTGRGQAFAEMVVGDMGGADMADDLAGVETMVERGVADPERLGVFGGSYGGFMSAWMVTQTDRFAAACALSPVTDWYSQHWTSNIGHWDRDFLGEGPTTAGGPYFERSPVMFASRVRTPTLVTAGVQDECTPPGQAVEFYRALREAGVEAELAIYPDEGHGVRKFPAVIDYYARIVGWFERHLPPAEPPATR